MPCQSSFNSQSRSFPRSKRKYFKASKLKRDPSANVTFEALHFYGTYFLCEIFLWYNDMIENCRAKLEEHMKTVTKFKKLKKPIKWPSNIFKIFKESCNPYELPIREAMKDLQLFMTTFSYVWLIISLT